MDDCTSRHPSTPTVTGRAVYSSAPGTWITCECVGGGCGHRLQGACWPGPARALGLMAACVPHARLMDQTPGCPLSPAWCHQCGGSAPIHTSAALAHPQHPPVGQAGGYSRGPSQFGTSGIPGRPRVGGLGGDVQGVSCFSQCKCVLGGRIAYVYVSSFKKKWKILLF